MRVVLGIDAAWTPQNSSGIALAVEADEGWKLLLASESYAIFHETAFGEASPHLTSLPDAKQILLAANKVAGRSVDVVAIDMPMSYYPISTRRYCDNEVSRVYGARHCSTHSPSELRPGKISDNLRKTFGDTGYQLQTRQISTPALIEVYPHPALVELAQSERRLPYKVAKIRNYWPTQSLERRRELLFSEWHKIANLLEAHISGVIAKLPKYDNQSSLKQLKAYEDALDAVVCVWVGISALKGEALPFGDQDAAIWIPRPT